MNDDSGNIVAFDTQEPTETVLIVEAIMREIARAKRWATVVDCWNALMRVRKMANDYAREMEHLNPRPGNTCCKQGDTE